MSQMITDNNVDMQASGRSAFLYKRQIFCSKETNLNSFFGVWRYNTETVKKLSITIKGNKFT